jgi:signal transduction histidine kinase
MTARWRDRFTVGVVVAALGLGLWALALQPIDRGVRLQVVGNRVVVRSVNARSPAAYSGIQQGMIAVRLNGATLIALPEYIYPSEDPAVDANVDANGEPLPEPTPIGVSPARPTTQVLSEMDLEGLVAQRLYEFVAIEPWDIDQGSVERGWPTVSIYDWYGDETFPQGLSFLFGMAVLFGGFWWLRTGRFGEALQDLALPLAGATAVPFLTRSLEATWSPFLVAAAGLLTVGAMTPLAIALIAKIDDERLRRATSIGTTIVGSMAAVLAIWIVSSAYSESVVDAVRWGLLSAMSLVPGLVAAGPIGMRPSGEPTTSRRLLQSTEYALAGATPMFGLAAFGRELSALFLALWLLAILLAGKFTVRPLIRLASRAQLQRDLVVAATEAERARLAADIHDEALQELTLLVRRLDTAGDSEGADMARTISDRLRQICGDLRLPILDDLGVGPALDWLVARIEKLAGGEVRLERDDGSRPPPDVELAFFRVAQEALANAVKHGRPPIVVRYRATASGVSLSVDDAGTVIARDAEEAAEQAGHFGLLNMQQRAEQVGAILDIRRWPAGGTHVAMEWRTR